MIWTGPPDNINHSAPMTYCNNTKSKKQPVRGFYVPEEIEHTYYTKKVKPRRDETKKKRALPKFRIRFHLQRCPKRKKRHRQKLSIFAAELAQQAALAGSDLTTPRRELSSSSDNSHSNGK